MNNYTPDLNEKKAYCKACKEEAERLLLEAIDRAEKTTKDKREQEEQQRNKTRALDEESQFRKHLNKLVAGFDDYLPAVLLDLDGYCKMGDVISEQMDKVYYGFQLSDKEICFLEFFTAEEFLRIRTIFTYIHENCITSRSAFYRFSFDNKVRHFKQMVLFMNEIKTIMEKPTI